MGHCASVTSRLRGWSTFACADSSPSTNRTEAILVLFAGLPCKMRHHVREMDGVLSGPATNLQHESRLRQDLRKNLCNWVLYYAQPKGSRADGHP